MLATDCPLSFRMYPEIHNRQTLPKNGQNMQFIEYIHMNA